MTQLSTLSALAPLRGLRATHRRPCCAERGSWPTLVRLTLVSLSRTTVLFPQSCDITCGVCLPAARIFFDVVRGSRPTLCAHSSAQVGLSRTWLVRLSQPCDHVRRLPARSPHLVDVLLFAVVGVCLPAVRWSLPARSPFAIVGLQIGGSKCMLIV